MKCNPFDSIEIVPRFESARKKNCAKRHLWAK